MFRRALRLVNLRTIVRPYHFSMVTRSFTTKPLERQEFKTETKQLLNIVAKSLYTDKEVFLRELVSNSADALEKLRLLQVRGSVATDSDLRISIRTNEADRTIVIEDTGIGMSRDELVEFLGTIAKSGSKKFVEEMSASGDNKSADSIIGQFGVGFYSSFIVADEVTVESRKIGETQAHTWRSQGQGEFEIGESDYESPHGTKITMKLHEECKEFSAESTIKSVLKKYSQFVSFPIQLNELQVNTLTAIWTRPKTEVSEDEYQEFFKYITNQKLGYSYVLHYKVDLPLVIQALLFIPEIHSETMGFEPEQQDISLYSRKVLIQQHCKDLLPNWLRFVKGVVDCEDLPLNVSREKWQDTKLLTSIQSLLKKRIIRFLIEQSNRDDEKYLIWYNRFNNFLKEGLAIDTEINRELIQLARYSWNVDDRQVSLAQYISQMKEGQKKIYFLFGTSKTSALNSPYLEPFIPKQVPVLISNHQVDEMIFRLLNDYQGFRFINIESSLDQQDRELLETSTSEETGIPEEELVLFSDWIKAQLAPSVSKVIISNRLKDSPAVILGDISSGLRQVMRMMNQSSNDDFAKNITFEVNFNHPIIVGVNRIRNENPELAADVLGQVYDNALLQAGLFENSTGMVKRLNRLLEKAVSQDSKSS